MNRDDKIYIFISDDTHKNLLSKNFDKINLSGFFIDDNTVEVCLNASGILDIKKCCQISQLAPCQKGESSYVSIDDEHFIAYEPHLACFNLNRQKHLDKFPEEHGFLRRARSKSLANIQWGKGGGNKYFRLDIIDLIKAHILIYDNENSYSIEDSIYPKIICPNPNKATNIWCNKYEYGIMLEKLDKLTDYCKKNDLEYLTEKQAIEVLKEYTYEEPENVSIMRTAFVGLNTKEEKLYLKALSVKPQDWADFKANFDNEMKTIYGENLSDEEKDSIRRNIIGKIDRDKNFLLYCFKQDGII